MQAFPGPIADQGRPIYLYPSSFLGAFTYIRHSFVCNIGPCATTWQTLLEDGDAF